MTQSNSLDSIELMGRLDGDVELLAELVEMFDETADECLQEAEQALSAGDAEALRAAAHSIKGAAGNLSGKDAFDAALNLEMMGRHEKLDDAPAALEVLQSAVVSLKSALQGLVKEKAACES